jgi:long-subunit acyl-CoA synthetase (AMP-forming)
MQSVIWTYLSCYLVCYVCLQNGTLKIIDRKKHIFKLSQGEYIVPEKIETIYIRSQYVQQVFVCGESLKASSLDVLYHEENSQRLSLLCTCVCVYK